MHFGYQRWALVALLASSATIVAGCSSSASPPTTPEASATTAPTATFADLVAKTRTGVVRIETESCDGGAIGTGFLLGPRLVATVEHVVDGAQSITLKRSGKIVGRATVVGADPARDLALLRTDRPISGYQFKFASRSPRLGEDVAVLGFPLGLPLTVTRGSVSGLDRSIPIEGMTRRKLVQTDAAVNPGNSGGPLLTTDGERVVGLVDLGTAEANGIAFAVSAEVAAPLLEAWRVAPQPMPIGACSGNGGTHEVAPPVETSPDTSGSGTGVASYDGTSFSVSYPAYWEISAGEVPKGSYSDTTIRDPNDHSYLLRVDVSYQASSSDPLVESAPVVRALRRQGGYRELEYGRFTFNGYDAIWWEFVVPESGVLLHKVDIVFVDNAGEGVAILTQAPASVWATWASALEAMRASLVMYDGH